MNLYKSWSLLFMNFVFGDIRREDNNFRNEFGKFHKGRVLSVLMVFNHVLLDECIFNCIKHVRCKSVNYHVTKMECELTDAEFNHDDTDIFNHEWYNYGTQPRVDGKWGGWRNVSKCTSRCEGGFLYQIRECDSPRPQHGGDDCSGEGERTVECNTHPCQIVNIALNKKALQSSTYAVNRVATMANDGDVYSAAITTVENEPWWQVDIGDDVTIEYIKFHANSYSLNHEGGYKRMEARVRTAESEWRICKYLGDLTSVVSKFVCDDPRQKARFVRMYSHSYVMLYVNEFEVYVKQR